MRCSRGALHLALGQRGHRRLGPRCQAAGPDAAPRGADLGAGHLDGRRARQHALAGEPLGTLVVPLVAAHLVSCPLRPAVGCNLLQPCRRSYDRVCRGSTSEGDTRDPDPGRPRDHRDA